MPEIDGVFGISTPAVAAAASKGSGNGDADRGANRGGKTRGGAVPLAPSAISIGVASSRAVSKQIAGNCRQRSPARAVFNQYR